ncbi:MAG: macro domain-containing protein [Anaerolineae bacterium]|nr:macro domain-containing protein [Anaerolineae bacterium]
MEITINNTVLRLAEGDITELDVDAIVNAANRYLQLGSGVAGAIRARGGPSIQRECDEIGRCPVGGAAITGGGNLKARHVIHAVGPHGGDADADEKMVSVTRSSLSLADQHGLKSMAFPAISTGVFGYPIDKCARFMIGTTISYLVDNPKTSVALVVFCLYGQAAFDVFKRKLMEVTNAR